MKPWRIFSRFGRRRRRRDALQPPPPAGAVSEPVIECLIESSAATQAAPAAAGRVPRTIYQTFRSSRVTQRMHEAASSWRRMNPEFSYEFFDDARMHEFVAAFDCGEFSFDRATLQRAMRRIRPGAGKADLFRYLLIFERGGVYMDIDTFCKTPILQYVQADDDVVTGLGGRGDFHQWGLIYSPRHPFLRQAIETAVGNILQSRFVPGYRGSLEGLSGPPCLDAAIKQVLGMRRRRRFEPGVFDVVIGPLPYRIRILPGDFFNHNVGFKYDGYRQDLQRLGVPYWSGESLFNDATD